MTHAQGTLVRARGREWVVLPGSSDDFLRLRPLGGSDDEIAGLYTPIEPVTAARFGLPTVADIGDHASARLLHDAVRLNLRDGAGPFRSFGRLGFEPRAYQLVPLLMALKLDPVRILIADDVGIGKTIEAGLIARELLDRGDAARLAVLCPPQLAEQWRDELRDKFALEAELVLAATAPRLERGLRVGESLFENHPYVVVSTDFIKSDRHRDEFLRNAPDLVIVDEAHTCADPAGGKGQRHQRYQVVHGLSQDPRRHLVLVTATPHSGNELAFRELIAFLDPSFREIADDLTPGTRQTERRRLARHFVQRRRGDIRRYLAEDTPFPERDVSEKTYVLTPEYRQLFARALAYARETIRTSTGGLHHQRVRWWSAIALLRALGSSPAAAAETLRSRARTAELSSAEEVDEAARRIVLDLDEAVEGADVPHGVEGDEPAAGASARPERRRVLDLARDADALRGRGDAKLKGAIEIVRELVAAGSNPIVFCRFIATAEYVKDELRAALGGAVRVEAVTGTLSPAEREERVAQLMEDPQRHVLVATDCLSEGVNLQHGFDAVVHYDLSWNPTRHEQREGRVDRYKQPSPRVKVITYYGRDNQIDGLVLDVLLRKHARIRDSLGISVPVPTERSAVVEAILEGLLLRARPGEAADQLTLFEDVVSPEREGLHRDWDASAEREKRSRTVFAQESLKVDEVAHELEAARQAIGSGVDALRFTSEVLGRSGATIRARDGVVDVDVRETPRALRDFAGLSVDRYVLHIGPPARTGALLISRTHPLVQGTASYVVDSSLDPLAAGIARRAGVTRTPEVTTRTTVLILRTRLDLITGRGGSQRTDVVEECRAIAFSGSGASLTWLDQRDVERLLELAPGSNVAQEHAVREIERLREIYADLEPQLNASAEGRGLELRDAHERVRREAGLARHIDVRAHLPADVLGAYVYLPLPRA